MLDGRTLAGFVDHDVDRNDEPKSASLVSFDRGVTLAGFAGDALKDGEAHEIGIVECEPVLW